MIGIYFQLIIKYLIYVCIILYLGDVIHFSQALPGTRYDFWLYYSNSSTGKNPTINNSPQQVSGSSLLPAGGGTLNNVVSSLSPSQSQWLLTWTASITTGTKNIEIIIILCVNNNLKLILYLF